MPAPTPAAAVTRQGHYAGAVSRLLAFVIDIFTAWGVATLVAAAVGYTAKLVTGTKPDVNHPGLAGVAYVVWYFVYFAYQWTLSGKTFGMALIGLRVVGADGAPVSGRSAVVRTLTLPLSFVLFGLGFVGILVQRERRALHDLIARTAVVYSWDARAARLRWLAREGAAPVRGRG